MLPLYVGQLYKFVINGWALEREQGKWFLVLIVRIWNQVGCRCGEITEFEFQIFKQMQINALHFYLTQNPQMFSQP